MLDGLFNIIISLYCTQVTEVQLLQIYRCQLAQFVSELSITPVSIYKHNDFIGHKLIVKQSHWLRKLYPSPPTPPHFNRSRTLAVGGHVIFSASISPAKLHCH